MTCWERLPLTTSSRHAARPDRRQISRDDSENTQIDEETNTPTRVSRNTVSSHRTINVNPMQGNSEDDSITVPMAKKQRWPTPAYWQSWRNELDALTRRNAQARLKPMLAEYYPHFNNMKSKLSVFRSELEGEVRISMGVDAHEDSVPTIDDLQILGRQMLGGPGERYLRQKACFIIYFHAHQIPQHMFRQLNVFADRRNNAAWEADYQKWEASNEKYIMRWALKTMEGIANACGRRRLSSYSETQVRSLLGAMFDKQPEAVTFAMWAMNTKGIAIVEFFQNCLGNAVEQRRRHAFQASVRYRQIELLWLVWKYLINVSGAEQKRNKSDRAVERKWRNMPTDDAAYRRTMAGFDRLQDVPVLEYTDSRRHKLGSLFI
jgi:hypothetical protein